MTDAETSEPYSKVWRVAVLIFPNNKKKRTQMQEVGVKLKNEYFMQVDQENVQSQKLQRVSQGMQKARNIQSEGTHSSHR